MTSSLPRIGVRPIIDGRRRGVRELLEEQTMAMARRTAALLSAKLRHPGGEAVECVIADTTIAGMAEAAACEAKFAGANVGATVSVTPCWCYGSETIDMDPLRPKAIWGFNGTERPGAVYLAAALAAHNQKGLPAFSIYGRDVQDAGASAIPADVEEKLLRFGRAALAVAHMRGKSYLSVGNVSMGIAGSIVNHDFFESWLGMRVQTVDMTEVRRRLDNGIYDKAELDRALAWADQHFRYGVERNAKPRSADDKRRILRESLIMTMAIRDMMHGNPKLVDAGWAEEALGFNAIVAGFQGQRQWTDQYPNADVAEALLNSSFDWNGLREPITLATENDSLNGVTMLFGHLLTNKAQIFADVRTYWSPDAVKRVTGHQLEGHAASGLLHLINSGAAALDGACTAKDAAGQPTMKPHWELTDADAAAALAATDWCPGVEEYFRGGGFSSHFLTPRRRAVHHGASEPGQGAGPGAAARRGLERRAAGGGAQDAGGAHRPELADHLVRPAADRQGTVPRRLFGDGGLGRQPRRAGARTRRRGLHRARLAAAHPGEHAQRRRSGDLSPERLGGVRHGRRGTRLSRLSDLRTALWLIGAARQHNPVRLGNAD